MLLKDVVPRLVMLWASSRLSVSPLEFLSCQEHSAGIRAPEDVHNLGLSTSLQAPICPCICPLVQAHPSSARPVSLLRFLSRRLWLVLGFEAELR